MKGNKMKTLNKGCNEMKNGKDFYISMESFMDALHLEGKDRKEMERSMGEDGVLAKIQEEIYVSVQAYMQIVLPQIDKASKKAKKLEQYDNLSFYEFNAKYCLQEWIVIIEHMSLHLAKEHRFKSADETVKLFGEVIEYLQNVFNHLIEANKLLVKFGQLKRDISTGSHTKK